jgi:hypothetical protein
MNDIAASVIASISIRADDLAQSALPNAPVVVDAGRSGSARSVRRRGRGRLRVEENGWFTSALRRGAR